MDASGGRFEAALTDLETELRRRAPGIAAALRPGLSADRFDSAARSFPHRIPDEVRQLYSWHDGTELVNGRDRAALFPGGKMMPFAEAVRQWADAQEGDRRSDRKVWDRAWLPLFTDDWGSWHVVNCSDDSYPVLAFSFVDLPRIDHSYHDLHHMVESLVRRWRSGGYRQGEMGSVEEDPRAIAAVYRAEDGALPDLERTFRDLDAGSEDDYIDALGLLRTRLYPEAVPGLIRLLAAGSLHGRRSAVELLGRIGDPAATVALSRAADADPDDVVRLLAKKSLKQLDTGS